MFGFGQYLSQFVPDHSSSNNDIDEAKEQSNLVYNDQHEGHLSHEVIAGGAAFVAMKKFEDSQRDKGQPIPQNANAFRERQASNTHRR